MADPVSSVIIVGGGPAGLSVATRLRRKDAVVLNATEAPGWPPHCTGLVSPWTARIIGDEAVTESFNEAVFMDDELRERCRLEGKPLAVRISRPFLEALLSRKVLGLGHRVANRMIVDMVRDRCVHVRGRGWLCASDSVVIATGYSSFSRFFGVEKCDTLTGLEVRARLLKRIREDAFITVHGRRFAPSFFAWIVPVSNGREALIGLASRRDTALWLSEFIHFAEKRGVLSVSNIISHRGGRILRGPPAKAVRNTHIYGIGDVLCASKPFTGGGLYSIAMLAPRVAKAIEKDGQELDEVWGALRREILAQRSLTRLALVYRELWWPALVSVCGAQDRCRVDYDRHSSLLECLLRVP